LITVASHYRLRLVVIGRDGSEFARGVGRRAYCLDETVDFATLFNTGASVLERLDDPPRPRNPQMIQRPGLTRSKRRGHDSVVVSGYAPKFVRVCPRLQRC